MGLDSLKIGLTTKDWHASELHHDRFGVESQDVHKMISLVLVLFQHLGEYWNQSGVPTAVFGITR